MQPKYVLSMSERGLLLLDERLRSHPPAIDSAGDAPPEFRSPQIRSLHSRICVELQFRPPLVDSSRWVPLTPGDVQEEKPSLRYT